MFHDILGDGFNIDHAIIGPAGIFIVETKTRSKPKDGKPTLTYDGNAIRIEAGPPIKRPLVQARAQAQWLANLLNEGCAIQFKVRPIVVFPEWYTEQIGCRTKEEVRVINPKALEKFVDYEPTILSPSDIDAAAHRLSYHCRASSDQR